MTQILTDMPWIASLAFGMIVFVGMALLQWASLRNQHETNQSLARLLGGAAPIPAAPLAPTPPVHAPVGGAPVKPIATIPSGPPPWFIWAQHEIGFHEAPGNTGIQKYIDLSHCGAEGEPWCAIFANAALEATGTPGTRSPSSQSFRTHPAFEQIQTPVVGCLVIFWRISKSSGQGHVGFYVSEDATHIMTLGGNENDQVMQEPLPKDSATFGWIGYWWPKSVPLPSGSSAITTPAKSVVGIPTPSTAPAHQTGITATVFGGQKSAYGGAIDDNSPGVALPFRFSGERPKVLVTSKVASVECTIVDVGPWNINDPYWEKRTRPQSETGTDMTGRKTNKAGIDLTIAAAKILQIDGKGLVDWNFIDGPQQPNVT